ncbi:hypothetical protein ACIBI4_28680 [Streptomyces sp. NPDC050418]|uniref:hypothetical protein n=1 Tax=Streptomyces sp. NPDC050418 TaxID=3365612 RepID=UPI00378FF5FF
MGWETLVGTVLGGTLGVGATLLAVATRGRRERGVRRESIRREIYAEFLGAVSRTYGQLIDSARGGDASLQERADAARSSLRDGGVFEILQKIRLIAPDEVVQRSEVALGALRELRTLIVGGGAVDAPEMVGRRVEFRAAEEALRVRMRRDLEVDA